MQEDNDTQVAQKRNLAGNIRRDYFGSNKRMWTLTYTAVNVSDYNVIRSIYDTYLSTGTAVPFILDETNYNFASTNVHVDLKSRGFKYLGSDYLSDFTLTLTEA